jgi:molybdopterin-guanine dinucleotide biosynthesis protein A
MGSLHAALQEAGPSWVLFVAVDLPLLETKHLQLLLDAAAPEVMAVVATSQNRIEPTCALYHTSLVPNVERAIESGQFALRALLTDVPHTRVPLPDRALTNVNRLQDLPEPE